MRGEVHRKLTGLLLLSDVTKMYDETRPNIWGRLRFPFKILKNIRLYVPIPRDLILHSLAKLHHKMPSKLPSNPGTGWHSFLHGCTYHIPKKLTPSFIYMDNDRFVPKKMYTLKFDDFCEIFALFGGVCE